jgi:hypothetical protein
MDLFLTRLLSNIEKYDLKLFVLLIRQINNKLNEMKWNPVETEICVHCNKFSVVVKDRQYVEELSNKLFKR